MSSNKITFHDTRGRKIVSANNAKNELLASYILFLLIFLTIKFVIVSFYNFSVESYLIGSVILGFTDAICFAAAWIATFKLYMKKFAIKEKDKRLIKSSFMMINICVIIFYSVYMIFNLNQTISNVKNEYITVIESFDDLLTEDGKNAYINDINLAIDEAKTRLYPMTFIELTLGICGIFGGGSFIRKEIENLGIDEEEYRVCTTTNLEKEVVPQN